MFKRLHFQKNKPCETALFKFVENNKIVSGDLSRWVNPWQDTPCTRSVYHTAGICAARERTSCVEQKRSSTGVRAYVYVYLHSYKL